MIEKKKSNGNDFTSEKECEIFSLNTRGFGSLIEKGSSTNENVLSAPANTNAAQSILLSL